MKYWRALIKVIELINDSLQANAEAPRSRAKAAQIHPPIYNLLFSGYGLSGLYPNPGFPWLLLQR